jgi:hypothetical protein
MAILIGVDEAGLGPNLGPYVVTATVWEVPGKRADFDLWQALAEIVTHAPVAGDARLHIADSKAVFQPGQGLAALERGVLTALRWCCEVFPHSDRELRRQLSIDGEDQMGNDPWYGEDDLPLPTELDRAAIAEWTKSCRAALARSGIRLAAVHTAILEPSRFNALIDKHQNKAEALSTVSLRVLKRAVQSAGDEPVFAVCDKHGGRNRYDVLLSACFDNEFVFRVKESAELSVYRLGAMEFRFQPRAECHLPVALASMVSKYVRELAMQRFNRFWTARVPGLKPTQGYPLDARRFRDEISTEQQRLAIPNDRLWRCR